MTSTTAKETFLGPHPPEYLHILLPPFSPDTQSPEALAMPQASDTVTLKPPPPGYPQAYPQGFWSFPHYLYPGRVYPIAKQTEKPVTTALVAQAPVEEHQPPKYSQMFWPLYYHPHHGKPMPAEKPFPTSGSNTESDAQAPIESLNLHSTTRCSGQTITTLITSIMVNQCPLRNLFQPLAPTLNQMPKHQLKSLNLHCTTRCSGQTITTLITSIMANQCPLRNLFQPLALTLNQMPKHQLKSLNLHSTTRCSGQTTTLITSIMANQCPLRNLFQPLALTLNQMPKHQLKASTSTVPPDVLAKLPPWLPL